MNLLLYSAVAACLAAAPDCDYILARDLLPSFPELASIDPLTKLAFAPMAGATRVFRVPELRQMAQRFGLTGFPAEELCVQRPMSPLTSDALLAAMQAALPQARISILEYSQLPAPAGAVEFPREGLHPPSGTRSAIWNGSVRYGGTRRFPIWARVTAATTVRRVVAISDLHTGQPIQPCQLLQQARDEFPFGGQFAESIEQVTGKWPRLSIRAGTEIRTGALINPKEIARGDKVEVDVYAGAAHLKFEGVAETAAGIGEMVSVRNPESNRRFRARVDGGGHVSVGVRKEGI